MFSRKKQTPAAIDEAIAVAHAHLAGTTEGTPEYTKEVDDLAKLYSMKASLEKPNRLSKDAAVAAVASVGSVALILIFEGVGRGIITSKSLGFAPKPKNKSN